MNKELLEREIFGIHEAAAITGVDEDKIRYWHKCGYIDCSTVSKGDRIFTRENIKLLVLIKKFLDKGYRLKIAAEKARNAFNIINQKEK